MHKSTNIKTHPLFKFQPVPLRVEKSPECCYLAFGRNDELRRLAGTAAPENKCSDVGSAIAAVHDALRLDLLILIIRKRLRRLKTNSGPQYTDCVYNIRSI